MEKEDVDVVFVYGSPDTFHGPGSIRYLCDYSSPMGEWTYFLARDGHSGLFLDEVLFWDLERAKEECSAVDKVETTGSYAKAFSRAVPPKKMKIGLENSHLLPERIYSELTRLFPDASFQTTNIIRDLRRTKSQSEIRSLREAERITENGMDAALSAAGRGKTESEVAEAGLSAIRRQVDELAFPGPEVLSGVRTAGQAGYPTSKKLKHGEILLVDLGGKKNGYCGDLTRVVAVGKPTKEETEMFATLKEMFRAAVKEIRPDNRISRVYESAKSVAKDTRYQQIHISHGIGLEVHEHPDISAPEMSSTAASNEIFQANMVVMIEIGLTIPGKMGMRYEDMILVTSDGSEYISTSERDLRQV